MAYDAFKTEEDEKKDAAPESPYAPLLTGSAPVAGTPAPHAAPATKPGFVDFSRYLRANKGTLDRMSDTITTDVNRSYAQIQDGAKKAQTEVNAAASSNAIAAPGGVTVADTQRQAVAAPVQKSTVVLDARGKPLRVGGATQSAPATNVQVQPTNTVSADAARANANAAYAGPTQADVASKYAPLLEKQAALNDKLATLKNGDYQSLGPTMSAFDSALLGGSHGGELSRLADQFGASKGMLDASQTTASKSATDAADFSAGSKSAWSDLLKPYEADKKLKEEEAARTAAAAGKKTWDDAGSKFYSSLGQETPAALGARPGGESVADAIIRRYDLGMNAGAALLGQRIPREKMVELFNKMPDADLQRFLNHANPDDLMDTLPMLARSYGVNW